ncbi:TIGR03960 family B12-binding radical SAM protein [Desulfogranum japonicum]|uniref:TIGR03960 family B12-binding radical SAM protein n=1 Tax=Desulfogranum japonicum TaxID=231447 RepID=UPI00040003B6|nr:TIGR03960 family B12-binding radical SAM protein [Desulfogranum japonicum]
MNNQLKLDTILPLVRKPGRYIGGELHSVNKNWTDYPLHYCLVFPDLYEIGMSHQGLQILYHILNRRDDALAHRCYTPDVDMEQELRKRSMPLFSLEVHRPLADYDVIGITLPYELCYTNILTVLELADIPLYSHQRGEHHPLVIGGGAGAMNPEPIADFFDCIALGDGEKTIDQISDVLMQCRNEGRSRGQILEALSRVKGMYVPSLFHPRYEDDKFASMEFVNPEHRQVQRAVLPEMHDSEILAHPLVPVVKPVHDRLGIEIARGCTRGCRFCQAGIIYRPVRERSREEILQMAKQGIADSGFDELALLSLSTGDYSCLGDLMTDLMDTFVQNHVSVSMPSMRVGTITEQIMDQIRRVRKTGFTIAPEAGTDRLREVINKGITEEDLLKTCHDAFSLGWKLIKFYFMIGLPTETDEDVDAIVELAKSARYAGGGASAKKITINVSVGTFVPKPHTPFQWSRQLSIAESKEKIQRLKELLPKKGFNLKWHDPFQSFLEGVFSRGDRRLAQLIETAWRMGARLDGWSEHFNLPLWQEAAQQCGLHLESYLEEWDMGRPLPWDHLASGVDKSFLRQEYERSLSREYTPDCRVHGCQKCGLCDFKEVRPIVHKQQHAQPSANIKHRNFESKSGEQPVFTYKVSYRRLSDSRFYGHLEILQLVFRALQRSGLPVLFSQGFNPSPKVSFSPALPVGMESDVEFFFVEMNEPLTNMKSICSGLNEQFPATIEVYRVEAVKAIKQFSYKAVYQIQAEEFLNVDIDNALHQFMACNEVLIQRVRKRKKQQIDIRSLVSAMNRSGDVLELELYHYHGRAGTNPREVLEKGLGLPEELCLLSRMRKISLQEIDTPA